MYLQPCLYQCEAVETDLMSQSDAHQMSEAGVEVDRVFDQEAECDVEELDEIFFGEPNDPAGDSAARCGLHRQELGRRQNVWQAVCDILDQGMDVARERITPTAMIDFPFCDKHGNGCKSRCILRPETHLDLNDENALLERAWVFRVMGLDRNTRLIMHGHTFSRWSHRSGVEVKHRADNLTAVNWRIAEFERGGWSQDQQGNSYLPIKTISWRKYYRECRGAQLSWPWRQWSGAEGNFPCADLEPGREEPGAVNRQKYRRIQTLLKLSDEVHVQEAYSKRQTQKAIRSHGQIVREVDIFALTRAIRRDVAPLEPAPRTPDKCDVCEKSPCTQSCGAWFNLHAAVLCIGVGHYENLPRLGNAIRDAEALRERANSAPRCRAELLIDPHGSREILRGVGQFLERDGLREDPPEFVIVGYFGHGTQPDANVYLLPADADPDDPYCRPHKDFVALNEVFELCKRLDDHARRKVPPRQIKFAVLPDSCRVQGPEITAHSSCNAAIDPPSSEAPVLYAICFSCSRNSVAMDGKPGTNSPFAQALLDEATGIFARGVPLKKALEDACRQLGYAAGASGQAPVSVGLHNIPEHLCAFWDPALASSGGGPRDSMAASARVVVEDVCDQKLIPPELILFFEGEGLKKVARKICETLEIENKEDLIYVTENDIARVDLLDWQVTKLSRVVSALKVTVAGGLSLPGPDLNESEELYSDETKGHRENSGVELAGRDGEHGTKEDHWFCDIHVESVAAKHPGSPDSFDLDMEGFIVDFVSMRTHVDADAEWGTYDMDLANSGSGQWTLCMLLWIRFMRDNSEMFEDSVRDGWRSACQDSPSQLRLCSALTECLTASSTPGHTWKCQVFEGLACRKAWAEAVFVTGVVVHDYLAANVEACGKWERDIVQDWFYDDDSTAADFFARANPFLREHVLDDICILQSPIKTRSYVALMWMQRLAAVLLFEYLGLRKLGCDHPVAGGPNNCNSKVLALHGFTMLVSSSRQVFRLTDAVDLAPSARRTVFQGLRCLSQLSPPAMSTMGPVKTAREYAKQAAQAFAKSTAFEAFHSAAGSNQTYQPDVSESGTNQTCLDEVQNKFRQIFEDDMLLHVMKGYLGAVGGAVGFYDDSATGERKSIEGESIPLVLFPCKSFDDVCGEDDAATQQALSCPISHRIMDDPVKCSDGFTYERSEIKKWFSARRTSPMTRGILASEPGEDTSLQCEPDRAALERIRRFKMEKNEEEERRKQAAEGEEEKRIWLRRYGLLDSNITQTNEGESVESADRLLARLLEDVLAPRACLIGPPASGKTVTMLQIVQAAVKRCSTRIKEREPACLPIFIRAADLSDLLGRPGISAGNLRQLVLLYLSDCAGKGLCEPGAVNMVIELFDLQQVFVCIDGLDEAASYRELIETAIDEAAGSDREDARRPMRVLLSTREASYTHSRAMRRLGEFQVVKLQPLDEDRQDDMIRGRLSRDEMPNFKEQMSSTAELNPELATSPFLLSLMIQVYKQHGSIPAQRVELYAKQVEGVIRRCMQKAGARHALELYDYRQERVLHLAGEYLECISYVCQMRLERRDFTLEACSHDLRGVWIHGPALLADLRNLLFGEPLVGLLSRVDSNTFRFSHLTLQEYLAACCTVRLYGHDALELVKHLTPFHSRWKREVLQFTACLLEESIFEALCAALMGEDDGAGANCEMVRSFLNERSGSVKKNVEKMLAGRVLELRGTENLIAGLCHPSSEARELLLSEMRRFCSPADVFGDGTVAKLRAIAEDTNCAWYRRRAAILSLAQVVRMEHYEHQSGRADTLKWMLGMLDCEPGIRQDIHWALTTGLGSVLKKVNGISDSPQEGIILDEDDEGVLLQALEHTDNLAVAEAIADLQIHSLGLLDWLTSDLKSHLIVNGKWPIRHFLLMQSLTASRLLLQQGGRRASRLVRTLLGRIHSVSVDESECELLMSRLAQLVPLVGEDDLQEHVLSFLSFGDAHQRARVLGAFREMCTKGHQRRRGDARLAAAGRLAEQVVHQLMVCRDMAILPEIKPSETLQPSLLCSDEPVQASRRTSGEADFQDVKVVKLVEAIPERSLIDRATKQYHLIDSQAALAPTGSPSNDPRAQVEGREGLHSVPAMVSSTCIGAEVSSPRSILGEEREQKLRKRAVDELVHGNFGLLHLLFEYLWREAKGRAWEDSHGGIASSSAVELHEELHMQELPPNMVDPVADWDLSTLCTALTATSLKAKLAEMSTRISPGRPSEVAWTPKSCFSVLVVDKIVTSADLEDKYASCFEAARTRAPQALQTIRFVLNILSHQKACVKGLSEMSFQVMWSVATEALETLARLLRTSHPDAVDQLHKRCNTILESLAQDAKSLSRDGALDLPLSSRLLSLCSPSFAASDDECNDDTDAMTGEGRDSSMPEKTEAASASPLPANVSDERDERREERAGVVRDAVKVVRRQFSVIKRQTNLADLPAGDTESTMVDSEMNISVQGLDLCFLKFCAEASPERCSIEGKSAGDLVCAKLWETSRLLPPTFSPLNNAGVSDSKDVALVVEKATEDLWNLQKPWFPENNAPNNSEWAYAVCAALRLKMVGRLLFSAVLAYIRAQFAQDAVEASNKLQQLAREIELWETDDREQQVERQLLLKELRIGRRAMNMPTWSGDVSPMYQEDDRGGLSSVHVRLQVEGAGEVSQEVVAEVSAAIADLSKYNILDLPEDLLFLRKQLKELKVDSTVLETLPEWLGDLCGLQMLAINKSSAKGSGLKAMPESTVRLTALQTLDLTGCSKLESLPESLGRLTGLQTLNLVKCSGLRELPATVAGLSRLESLNLKHCEGIVEVPECVGRLTGLQTLNLGWCSGLTRLPESIGDMAGLKSLIMNACTGLKTLPRSVKELTGLQILDLDGSEGLDSLPESIGGMKGLKTMILSGCRGLKAIPESVGGLQALQSLSLGGCSGLKVLPETIGDLTELVTCELGGCLGLGSLPEAIGRLTALQNLNLGICKGLKVLPQSIGDLAGLRTLNLGGSSGLERLPDSIGALSLLQTLTLGGCTGLKTLPESVGGLQRLQTLDLYGCRGLVALPTSVGQLTGLDALNLGGCSGLNTLPETIVMLKSLRGWNM